MIYDEIADTLLRAGIPVNTKGFIYIHDALELMDKDPYYFSGKICALYAKIAKQNGASFAQVERGILYAFEGALTRGIRNWRGIIWTPSIPKAPINSKSCFCGGNRTHIRERQLYAIICPYAVRRYTTRSLLR